MTLWALVFLWTAPVLQVALVLVFWNRRFFLQKFPAFFRYTSFSVVASVLQISLFHNALWYYWVYWIDQTIYGVLALLAMREVFQMVWDMRQGLRRYLVWALIFVIGTLSVWWGTHQSGWRSSWNGVNAAFYVFMAGVRVVEVMLCGITFWLIRKFTRYHIGIMLGFGVSAIIQVLAYVGHFFHLGAMFKEALLYAPLSAYMGAAGTWLFTFLSKPELDAKFDPDAAIELIRQQERFAEEISSELGLKWPRKEKDNGSKPCAAPA